MTQIIEARGVVHRYGDRTALNGFDLEVEAGRIFGLLGPNGSGKSTFISLVAAMENPQAGSLLVFGGAPSAALRARVGTVFQENAHDPLMTPGETLALAGRLFGVTRARARADHLLELMGLSERRGDTISALSGGMRRRLELARALMHDPQLLILDEPTTGVDPGERRALWEALGTATDGRQRTVMLASNDLAEADSVCDVVAFVDEGRVVTIGSPADLKRGLRRESLRVSWPAVTTDDLATLSAWPGIGDVARDGDEVRLSVDDASSLVPRLFELAPHGIRGVNIHLSTLENAYFQHVRGRHSREEVPA